jgi:RNA polymerase sigma factor (sigma-70 family)
LTDAQLLDRFASGRDESAFELLVARHGPMVLSLCRRLLRNMHDADDAFQATFLILVRKAGAIRERNLLSQWLYGVAFRTALRARAANARRQAHERRDADPAAAVVEPAGQELRWLLHEELNRLPAKYRVPVVLCYLEGHTNEEAARRLHWPVGTVKGRLARARALLRRRLTGQGLTFSSGALAAALSPGTSTALPPPLIVSTVKAAVGFAAGGAAAPGGVSPAVLALTNGSLRAMGLDKLRAVAAVLVAAALVVPGAGWLAAKVWAPQAAHETPGSGPTAPPPRPSARPALRHPETVELKTRFLLNRPFYEEVNTEVKQWLKVEEQEVIQRQAQTFWFRHTPQGEMDGNLLVKQKIVGVRQNTEIGGNKIDYDSMSKDQPANALASFYQALMDGEFTVYLNVDGKSGKTMTVSRVEGLDGFLKKLPSFNTQLQPLQALFRNVPGEPFPGVLPGRAMRKGETWTGNGTQDLGPLGQYLTSYHYTYQGTDSGLERISVEMSLSYTPPPVGAQAGLPFNVLKADLKTQDSSGLVRFDRARGRIVGATLATRLQGTLHVTVGGISKAVELVQKQTTTIKTSDTNLLP